MKFFLEKVILVNRAPFDKLELDFNENEIAVLTAINGSGKTTLLSHIVDAWHEIIRPHYPFEFEGKENKYYRVSSRLFNLIEGLPSFVYIRFRNKEKVFDYIDIRNKCTEEEYLNAFSIENRIPFHEIKETLDNDNYIKKISFSKEDVNNVFSNNIITYFPAYRFETPGYLNDPFKISLSFNTLSGFSGYLTNPIEVVTGLPQLANWILDIILDMSIQNSPLDRVVFENLNTLITHTLISRQKGNLRFGIGPRKLGSTRIQIMSRDNDSQIYPSIFNLSSGESALLCIFGELLKQADNYRNNIKLSEVTGIVLIDEIDKHLHIKLQKEILPELFNTFPNVQFIVSSHSPFLNMGLAERLKDRSKIIDLDNMGVSFDPTSNDLYREVYNMMINENNRFKNMYVSLNEIISKGNIPLIITEGKTDIQHIKKAKDKLNISELEIEFYVISDNWGDSKLKLLLEQLSKIRHTRKIIGIFDRDDSAIVREIEKDGQLFKDYSNNVYGFCIPIPTGRESYSNISIEFYYSDEEIKKEKDGRRLFFDNEVDYLYNKSTNQHVVSVPENVRSEKEHSKKIFDEQKICELTNWIHSKANFARLIETDEDFASDFDFLKFSLIFDRVKLITIENPH